MSGRRRRRTRGTPRGASVVEFAVVAPILLLLVLGLIEFGRVMIVQQALVAGARESCRVAALSSTTRQDVLDRAAITLNAAGVTRYTVTLRPDPPSAASAGDAVSVTIQAAFNDVSWLTSPIYLRGRTLGATCVMRREWSN